ncbi:MAG: hypothetical protein RL721_2293 [Candidatus Eisenbacteria bacterium]
MRSWILSFVLLLSFVPSLVRAATTNPDISVIGQPRITWTDDARGRALHDRLDPIARRDDRCGDRGCGLAHGRDVQSGARAIVAHGRRRRSVVLAAPRIGPLPRHQRDEQDEGGQRAAGTDEERPGTHEGDEGASGPGEGQAGGAGRPSSTPN